MTDFILDALGARLRTTKSSKRSYAPGPRMPKSVTERYAIIYHFAQHPPSCDKAISPRSRRRDELLANEMTKNSAQERDSQY